MISTDAVKPVAKGARMRTWIARLGLGRPIIRSIAVVACSAAALSLAACAGDNLFEQGGVKAGGGPPIVTVVDAPATVREGATVDVRVKAIGRRGITKIDIRYRGAINQDQSFPISPVSSDTVTVDASIELSDTTSDATLRIEVFATDAFGGVSAIVSRTVNITDASAPSISASVGSTTASAGGNIALTVSARDELGLKQVGYAIVTANGDTLGGSPTLFDAAGTQRDTIFNIPLPATLQPSQVKVFAIAVNASNLRGVSSPLAVSVVDSLKPTVDIVEPNAGDSYPLRDSIAVRVHVADASGIKSVTIRGVSFRFFPDSTQNSTPIERFTAVTVPFPQGPDRPLPTDTLVFRFLKPTADTVSEPIFIIASATDAQNNTAVDTVRIIPGPRVVIVSPLSGSTARVNSDLLVRVQANDPQAGLDSLKLFVMGAQRDSFVFKQLGGTREQIERLITLHIGNDPGTITLRADVFNSLGVRGSNSNIPVITIATQLASDTVAPQVKRSVSTASRIELGDAVKVTVTATDGVGSGIARLGAVIISIPANETPELPRDTFYLLSRPYSPALSGTPDTTFAFKLSEVYKEVGAARFPLPFTLQVHAFAIDAQGNCGAAVQESFQALKCGDVVGGPAGFFVAAGQTGQTYNPIAVVGTSVALPAGSVIADALPDTTNRQVYLSNFARNQVEVLSLSDTAFVNPPIAVGSQPWGLFLIPGGATDTLMVANSGGTNISFVPTDSVNPMREVPSKRLLTPNDRLFEIEESLSNGFLRLKVTALEFSDRPQFIAQDANKVILYSTKPTAAGVEGTIRMAVTNPAFQRPDVKIIFGREAIAAGDNIYAVARVDSIIVRTDSFGDDYVDVWDHEAGFPDRPIRASGFPAVALDSIQARGSDALYNRGSWSRSVVGFSDTTYIAYAKNLKTLAFGEGAVGPFGRIVLWTASTDPSQPERGFISADGTADLISNAAERVSGLALNIDGSFGVARGLNDTYFFSNNIKFEGQLRLQGVFNQGVAGGNGGVALHPNHGTVLNGSDATTMAFIATGNKTVKIVDTFHYNQLGEVAIRDNIVGQLRAMPPNPSFNTGLAPERCDYTIVQLFGVTSTNNLAIVNIRTRDINPGCIQ